MPRRLLCWARGLRQCSPVAEQFNVPRYYTRLDDFLADQEVQAVYIATPNNLHKEETMRCAEAGKHVLCEKPMAMNVAEGREMIAACRANGVKLGVALMMRFHAAHLLARDLVSQGKLGRILMARAQFGFAYPPRDGAWRQSLAQGGGGPVMDLAAHSLDVMEMIVGPISELTAQVDHLAYDYTAEDSATALFRFQNGAHGVTDVQLCHPRGAQYAGNLWHRGRVVDAGHAQPGRSGRAVGLPGGRAGLSPSGLCAGQHLSWRDRGVQRCCPEQYPPAD